MTLLFLTADTAFLLSANRTIFIPKFFRVAPVEFELTPYEMLMEEIRGQRYTLHKVPPEAVNTGDHLPPNVTRDAHDVILEFIRSRPPLKPVRNHQQVRLS